MPSAVVYAFNLSTREAEAGRALGVQANLGLQSNFQDSREHRETLSQEERDRKRSEKRERRERIY